MVEKKASAEIFEFDAARARRDGDAVDPRNFVHVGAYLAAVREAAGLSVETLSAQTHIKPQFIAAIEELDRSRLPAKPFAIGFARSYAEALGLEGDAIGDRFRVEAGYDAPQNRATTTGQGTDHGGDHEKASSRNAQFSPSPTGSGVELSLLAVAAILAFIVWCALVVTRPAEEAVLEAPAATPLGGRFDPAAYDQTVGAPPAPQDLVEARILDSFEPVFPPRCLAGAAPVETVAVAFTVRVDGRVVSERVEQSSNRCFNSAALGAVRQWRYAPRTVDGAPQAAFDQRALLTFRKPN